MGKSILSLIMSLILIMSFYIPLKAEEKAEEKIPITIKLDNQTLYFDKEPIIENGRTLVPFRGILEAMGAAVEWNAKTKTITCKKKTKTIILTIGSKTMMVDNKAVTLDVPPKIIDKRTLIPLRAVSQALDAEVEWDLEKRLIEITTKITDFQTNHTETTKAKAKNTNTSSELHNIINQLTQNRGNLDKDSSSELVTLLNQIYAYERTIKNSGNITDTEELQEIQNQYKVYIQKLKNLADKNGIILS